MRITSTTSSPVITKATTAAGPAALITTPLPTNRPAPMTPPRAIIVMCRCFRLWRSPLAGGAVLFTLESESYSIGSPGRSGSVTAVLIPSGGRSGHACPYVRRDTGPTAAGQRHSLRQQRNRHLRRHASPGCHYEDARLRAEGAGVAFRIGDAMPGLDANEIRLRLGPDAKVGRIGKTHPDQGAVVRAVRDASAAQIVED